MHEIKIQREEIRQRLKRATEVYARSEGVYANKWYRNEYRLSDFDILHDFEAPDLTDATATFAVAKPLLILYVTRCGDERGSVDVGTVEVEFQVIVNYEPDGFVKLLGYLELLRVVVNPREKGFWLPVGLAPRRTEEGPIINGEAIKHALRDRVLVQSLMCKFTEIGAN